MRPTTGIAGVLLLALALGACDAPAPQATPGSPPPQPATTATPSAPPSGAAPTRAPPASAPPAGATPTAPAAPPSPEAVLVGAGDIASCDGTGDSATAALLDRTPGTVFTLGDNAYDRGSAADFARCYHPTWGRHRARTRPVVGNHEYGTRGAAGHFGYFGAAAGPPDHGYYSYDAGSWHVVVLNSNCASLPGGCRAGSPQERWLRADLAASGARCTVAMMHHPLFTSGWTHGPARQTRPLVQALYEAGVEVLLAGHNHQYERFAPQTPDGRRDDARGVRAFVVGTGGAGRYPFRAPRPHSEVRDHRTYGVLRLELTPDAYRWNFLPVAGGTFTDTGTGTCH